MNLFELDVVDFDRQFYSIMNLKRTQHNCDPKKNYIIRCKNNDTFNGIIVRNLVINASSLYDIYIFNFVFIFQIMLDINH